MYRLHTYETLGKILSHNQWEINLNCILNGNFYLNHGNRLPRFSEGKKADAQSRTGDLLITNQALYQLSYIGLNKINYT